jgi:hypothetical protein
MPRKPHLSGRWQPHAPGQLNMIEFKKAIKVPEIFADLIPEFARILTDIKLDEGENPTFYETFNLKFLIS